MLIHGVLSALHCGVLHCFALHCVLLWRPLFLLLFFLLPFWSLWNFDAHGPKKLSDLTQHWNRLVVVPALQLDFNREKSVY